MGGAMVWLLAGVLAGSGAGVAGRVVVPEGWYQLEDGYGEAEDSEVVLVEVQDEPAVPQPPQAPERVPPPKAPPPQAQVPQAAPPPQQLPPSQIQEPQAPPPQPREPQAPGPQVQGPTPSAPALEPPPIDEEIARFLQPDCELVRGRYLKRILELHGVNTFDLDPRALAAWTYQRPPPQVFPYGYNGSLDDPALAPLYGEPPIPPGPLSYDLELQSLARQLLRCQNQGAPPGR